MSRHNSTYTIDVAADSAAEAIAVAAEALPRGATVINEAAEPAANSIWRVTLRYVAAEGRGTDPIA